MRIRPQAVATGQGSIDRCVYPIAFAGGRDTDRAGCVAGTGDTRWWIGVGPVTERQQGNAGAEGEGAKVDGIILHCDC